jgi:small basic protein (TIGR04137 family)
MSIHSSLRGGAKGKKHRSVLKRHERLKVLREKNLWSDVKSVLGIPKVKMQRVRVKKEKAASPEAAAAGAAGPGAPGAPSPAAGAPAKGGQAPAAKPEKK